MHGILSNGSYTLGNPIIRLSCTARSPRNVLTTEERFHKISLSKVAMFRLLSCLGSKFTSRYCYSYSKNLKKFKVENISCKWNTTEKWNTAEKRNTAEKLNTAEKWNTAEKHVHVCPAKPLLLLLTFFSTHASDIYNVHKSI